MTDLTVLVSPIPLYPDTGGSFPFGLRSTRSRTPVHPIMVTLETEIAQDKEKEQQQPEADSAGTSSPNSAGPPDFVDSPASFPGVAAPRPRRPQREPVVLDSNLLSPPVNTWKAARPIPTRHRPTRSQSAPPERRSTPSAGAVGVSPIYQQNPAASVTTAAFNQPPLLLGGPRNPKRSFTSFTADRQTTQGGELVRPPPPLLRPTTFWRKTRRSGVTGASYSPSSHLIRRSTYVAAGLAFDAPVHDLSALCVESRVGFIVIPPDQELL